ncbi:MAG: glycoside hydrolase family 65 protein, partial [Bacteroidales bacterium]
MHKYLIEDEWMVIEDHFDPKFHKSSESLFSLGNGHMGLRANFEESYSGPSLQGSYIAGIYYPDKTRVGWWKNGYPEYFAKVLNAPSWIRMSIQVDGKELDLFTMKVHQFTRTLDMHKGLLIREFKASWPDGTTIKVETERFLSMKRKEIAAIRYRITPVDCSPEINANLIIDG